MTTKKMNPDEEYEFYALPVSTRDLGRGPSPRRRRRQVRIELDPSCSRA